MSNLIPLRSDIHLYTAATENRPVVAFMGRELIGSGKITEITPVSVRINGAWYLRETCEFYMVRRRYHVEETRS